MSDRNPKRLFQRTEAYSIFSNKYSKRSMKIKSIGSQTRAKFVCRRHFLSFKFPIVSESVLSPVGPLKCINFVFIIQLVKTQKSHIFEKNLNAVKS